MGAAAQPQFVTRSFIMSAFTKQVAKTTRATRIAAKQLSARVALLKHPAVRAAFEAFPVNQRMGVNLSLIHI